MNAVMLGGSSVVAGKVFMMTSGFVVILIVMVIMMVRIHSDCMDGITRGVVMLMGMRRRGRNEAVACECKR